MKSSFLISIILTALVASPLWGQTTKKATGQESSFDKFSERLKIGYFGAFQGSSLGEWDGLALDEHGEKYPDYAHNLFNQVSFNYNFGAKMNFVLNPRWTINTGDTKDHSDLNDDFFVIEDMMAGFQGVIVSSEDKKFNWWLRTVLRLPTSRLSRENDVTFQPDIANNFTYDFNTTWQLGTSLSYRHWIFEDRYNFQRFRIYVAPYVQYSIDDTTKAQLWWETYADNRDHESLTGRDITLKESWQNVMLGVAKDITPKFNLFPFIGYHLNTTYAYDKPIDAAWFGFWVSYSIK